MSESVRRRAVATALVALLALPALLAPRNFPSDDSLFYLQIARNIAAGRGSTFNTVTTTTGFHPLWMIPCVVAAWFTGGEPTRMLRVVFAMQIVLALVALALYRAVARRLDIRSWPLGVPVLATYFLTGMYGSEAHMNGACVLASTLVLLRFCERPEASEAVTFGMLLGVTMLARLDNLFLAVVMTIAATATAPPRERLATLARVALPAAVVVAPYLGWNFVRVGHVMPISGAIKSTFPRIVGDLRNLGVLGLLTFATAAAAALGVTLARVRGPCRLAVGTLSAGVLLHGLYIVLYTNHNTHWSWYYVSGVVLATLVLGIAADAVAARVPVLRHAGVASACVVLLAGAGIARAWARFLDPRAVSHNQLLVDVHDPVPGERWEIQFARYLERTLPPHAGVLAFDHPGHLAFYSTLRIVPTDGLVGDYSYDTDLRRDGLRRYLSDHDIAYYVGADLDPKSRCREETIFTPLHPVDVGSLILCPDNLLATTPEVVRGPEPDVAVYRIDQVDDARGVRASPLPKHGRLW